MKSLSALLFLISVLFSPLFSQSELLLDGFGFTEGPVVDNKGNLYFTDIPESRIYVYYNDKLDIFLENSGGANGLYFDTNNNIIACAGKARQVISISPAGEIVVIASEYEGKKLNSPNDLWVDPQGGIYFTDPRYGDREDLEQDGMHVYYVSPDKNIVRVTKDLVRPNGIIGTPDGKILYIIDQGVEKTYRYRIKKNGQLGGKNVFADYGTDGMSIDNEGNIYITNGKNIDLYNNSGELMKTYEFPAFTTNVVWSEQAVYVTTQAGQVFIIRNPVEGDK